MWQVWLQKYKNLLWAAVALILTFVAGWQVGRVTSPYYAAHPIIFQGSEPAPSALSNLIASSTPALKEGEARPEETGRPAPQPSAAAGEANVKTQGKYVASVNSTLYHDSTCSSAKQIKPANQVWFDTKEEAEAAGYSPSACTKEKLGL